MLHLKENRSHEATTYQARIKSVSRLLNLGNSKQSNVQ